MITAAQGPDVGQITMVVATCVTALAAAASGIAATVALLRTRRSTGASQLYAFIVDWDSPAMLGMRHRAAAGRLKSTPAFDRDAFEILNFFETIGYMVNEIKVVPERACWLAFSDVLACYSEVFRPQIEEFRDGDPTAYKSLRWLEARMLEITAQELRRHGEDLGDGRPKPSEIDAFLKQEAALPDNREPLATATRIIAMPSVANRRGGWRWLGRRTSDSG